MGNINEYHVTIGALRYHQWILGTRIFGRRHPALSDKWLGAHLRYSASTSSTSERGPGVPGSPFHVYASGVIKRGRKIHEKIQVDDFPASKKKPPVWLIYLKMLVW